MRGSVRVGAVISIAPLAAAALLASGCSAWEEALPLERVPPHSASVVPGTGAVLAEDLGRSPEPVLIWGAISDPYLDGDCESRAASRPLHRPPHGGRRPAPRRRGELAEPLLPALHLARRRAVDLRRPRRQRLDPDADGEVEHGREPDELRSGHLRVLPLVPAPGAARRLVPLPPSAGRGGWHRRVQPAGPMEVVRRPGALEPGGAYTPRSAATGSSSSLPTERIAASGSSAAHRRVDSHRGGRELGLRRLVRGLGRPRRQRVDDEGAGSPDRDRLRGRAGPTGRWGSARTTTSSLFDGTVPGQPRRDGSTRTTRTRRSPSGPSRRRPRPRRELGLAAFTTRPQGLPGRNRKLPDVAIRDTCGLAITFRRARIATRWFLDAPVGTLLRIVEPGEDAIAPHHVSAASRALRAWNARSTTSGSSRSRFARPCSRSSTSPNHRRRRQRPSRWSR